MLCWLFSEKNGTRRIRVWPIQIDERNFEVCADSQREQRMINSGSFYGRAEGIAFSLASIEWAKMTNCASSTGR